MFPEEMTEFGGVSLEQVRARFGTPTYLYDLAIVARQIDRLRQFDVIRYAVKANASLALLRWMRSRGVLLDVVSPGEVHRAMAAGYRAIGHPPEIVFTTDVFQDGAVDCVVAHGLHVNLGSPGMIAQIGSRCPGTAITLRVNPGFGDGHHQKTNTGGEHSKHGIWHEQLEACLQLAAKYDVRICGLHMHIGSGADWQHLSRVCSAMEEAALRVGRSLTSISAGGGLPVPYRDGEQPLDVETYYGHWNATRNRLQEALGHAITLEVEPGRFLVAEAGVLLATVCEVKRSGRNEFCLLDAGFHNLARPILYGAYHPIAFCGSDLAARPRRKLVVAGPLCESGDVFTQDADGHLVPRLLPLPRRGDLAVIQNAGAYGFVMSSNYNSQPLAAEVLVDRGQLFLARPRQTLDDLIRGEQAELPAGFGDGRAPGS